MATPTLECKTASLVSPFPGQPTFPRWWKLARIWQIPSGILLPQIRSRVARPISAIRSGRIIPAVSTASPRRDERRWLFVKEKFHLILHLTSTDGTVEEQWASVERAVEKLA